ncbi:hypothetical protein ONZ45_g3494 [Pleurotus djamor]|nr:hypothetical protein ONZ45_g3494 [Pleurotus djamor]
MEPPTSSLLANGSFTQTRLNRPSIELSEGFNALKTNIEIINAVEAFRKESKTAYSLGVDVLNAVLHAVYGNVPQYFSSASHPPLDIPAAFPSADGELVCIDVNSRKLRCHPYQHFNSRTDFAILPKSIADDLNALNLAPAYHHTVSLGELKILDDKKKGPKQCMTYLGIASQALPHRVSLLGHSIWSGGYTLHWSSPSGVDCSNEFGWDKLQPLLEYAYTLYHPPADKLHLFFDETVTLSDGLSLSDDPRWDVRVEGVEYKRCEVRMVGEPWHRMSWVVVTTENFVIKDQYRSDDSTFTEGELYETVHAAGFALGFADMVSYTPLESHGQPIQIEVDGVSRTKTRIVLATIGDPFSKCKDLQQLLRVSYDAIEAHRHAVTRDVLHRDLSMGNILINPKFARTPTKEQYQDSKRPRFINEVMNGVKNANPEALIIDLDNASKYKRPKDEEYNLHERTGTPKYIARAVSLATVLFHNAAFAPMPTLPAHLKTQYEDAYEGSYDHPLRCFTDSKRTTHNGKLSMTRMAKYVNDPSKADADFKHRPRHDVESVFWCLLVFLIQVLPATAQSRDDDVNNEAYNTLWANFRDHEIPDDDVGGDSRAFVFMRRQKWPKILHEHIAFVAPLLDELVDQVSPEYALLKPSPDKFHLHEAVQRILFKYMDIWRDEKISFHTEVQRNTIIDPDHKPTNRRFDDGHLHNVSKASSKRKAAMANLPERPPSPKADEPGEHTVHPSVGTSNGHKRTRVKSLVRD